LYIIYVRLSLSYETNNSGPQIKFNLKSLILVLIFLVGVYFLIPNLIGLQDVFKLFSRVNKYYLAVALFAEVMSYVGATLLLGTILSRLGYKIKFWTRFRISSIASFAIHFFPVGSFGEGAADYYFLRRARVEPGSILITLVLRIIITYASFLLIFLFGLILVPIVPQLEVSPKIISFIILALVIGSAWYLFYLYQHKEKFRALWNKFFGFFDGFVSRIRSIKVNESSKSEIFEDIYQGLGLFGKKKRSSFYALFSGLLYWAGDITCFYFVFLSFGYHIPVGVLIFGYGVATLLGMVSFIPGGLGVTEGSMALVYSSMGIPSAIALTSILVFRFFSFWIWIPFGLYSFVSLSRKKQ
jgi:glycosyltransferase 2 family protein